MLTSDHGPIPKIVPDGHFCSPLVDPNELKERRAELWSPNPPLRGIDYRGRGARALREAGPADERISVPREAAGDARILSRQRSVRRARCVCLFRYAATAEAGASSRDGCGLYDDARRRDARTLPW